MMGRRKRGDDINTTPPPSDLVQHHEERQLKQKSSDRPETSATQHAPSIMDVTGSSLTRPQGHQSPPNQNHGASHGILLRHSRHYLDHNYSRRGSINHTSASPSNWKGTSVYDTANLSFKLAKCRELMFHKLKRIRARSSTSNAESAYTRKMECGICQKRLKKKSFKFDNSNSSSEPSVVGVLVCGHVYHADCLELKTIPEDMQDPPCPICKHQL
ncbi:uncharacterized protein LOC142552002 [Primulina tabacum]|uniref:uncharacterized protein LOC142552002 n=1 Tax=Primulina tabacum TaxID=48773 RepID=UPI003F5AC17C